MTSSPNFTRGGELEEALLRYIRDGKLELTEKWVTGNEALKVWAVTLFPDEIVNHEVLEPREGKRTKHKIKICSVRGTEYENVRDTEGIAIYAGGPGSMVAAALDSVSAQGRRRKGKVLYATYRFEHSNARSSAYYFHLRHSNALDADPTVRGPVIVGEFLRRLFVSNEGLAAEARRLGYMKIDISVDGLLESPSTFLKVLGILGLGFVHTLRNVAFEKAGLHRRTDWVRNRAFSWYSIPVLRFLEAEAARLGVRSGRTGKPALLIGQEVGEDRAKAIHVLFDEGSAHLTEDENELLLKNNGIMSQKLTRPELALLMGGDTGAIHSAYIYPQDGRVSSELNVILRAVVEATGSMWQEGVEVEKVFVDELMVVGVLFRDAASGKRWYQPCSSVVLSLGYTACYEIERPHLRHPFNILSYIRSLVSGIQWTVGMRNPVGSITFASGGSGYFLVRGRIPIIGTQNSHWTEVAYSEEADITLAKMTGGGNIASEFIPVTYPLNNLEHIRKMFGDRFLDVLSLDSCPRSINPQNDVQFYQLASGLVIVVGLGGTGMTKSGANGALSVLLSRPELRPSELVPGAPHLFDGVDTCTFVTDCRRNMQRALGHRQDYSVLELSSALVSGFVVWQLWKRHRRKSGCSPPQSVQSRSSFWRRMYQNWSFSIIYPSLRWLRK